MHKCFSPSYCIAIFLAITTTSLVKGQTTDSLLHLLNNGQPMDDARRFNLLNEVIASSNHADTILKYCDETIKLAEKLDINPAPAFVYKGFGYLLSGKLASSLECLMKAANFYKKENNNVGLATAYTYIAEAYNQQENYNNSKLYLRNAVDIFRTEKDTLRLATTLHNLGYVDYCIGQYDTALILYTRTSEIYLKLGMLTEYGFCLGNSGLVYSRRSEFIKAEDYLLRAIDILTKQGDERGVTQFMIEYAGILQHKGEIEKGIASARRSLDKATKNNFLEFERDAANRLAILYKASGKYDSAFFYQSLYINANDSIKSFKSIQKMADLRTEFEVSKKQAEVDTLRRNRIVQLIVISGLALILLLAIALIMLYYYSLKRSRKLTAALDERRILLEKQGAELKKQGEELLQQKEEIISSITYAKKIQSAILPPERYINELLGRNFILYKPKEIVSGDFYWVKQVRDYIIIVCADCTGHGVPGAFMSVLGISLLNEIVERKEVTRANLILNEMREEIKQALRQVGEGKEQKDGLDIALCVIDNKNMMLQYSGANIPLYIIKQTDRGPEFKEILADPMPVGVYMPDYESFSVHEVQLEEGDVFYTFSDGYRDQNGGDKNKRFTSSRFRKLLLDIHEQPMAIQKGILEQTLIDWMGTHSQRDDILVIGIKI
jgi:serine phosphatase RsbU (regulator of sigma subunit)